jgi:hypothetical protein
MILPAARHRRSARNRFYKGFKKHTKKAVQEGGFSISSMGVCETAARQFRIKNPVKQPS